MPTKTGEPKTVNLRGVDWKKPMSISAEKYNEVSKAILAGLTAEPVTFTELSQRVARQSTELKGMAGRISALSVIVLGFVLLTKVIEMAV